LPVLKAQAPVFALTSIRQALNSGVSLPSVRDWLMTSKGWVLELDKQNKKPSHQ
jgi:hypothetical protein